MADQSQVGANQLPYGTLGLANGQPAPPSNIGRPGLQIVAARRPANTMPWYGWVILAVVVAGFVAAVMGFAFFMADRQIAQQKAEQGAFQPVINDFLFAPVKSGPGESRPRLGKVVLVDVEKRAVDPLHLSLPDDLRAVNPEEATTVGQMRYTRKEVGRYEGGSRGIQLSCTLTVVDRATRKVIANESFYRGPPPVKIARTSAKEDVVGAAPWKEISRFLAGLR
jgi:hypothetical protein